jgi:hypothetical protein
VLIEYVMLRGINDSEDDARRLARILAPINCKVNLVSDRWQAAEAPSIFIYNSRCCSYLWFIPMRPRLEFVK